MELDMTRIMILLQRKYSAVREIDRLTGELREAFARNDEVSADMLLDMRAEEMAKVDACVEEIWQEGKSDSQMLRKLRVLLTCDPAKATGNNSEEAKIYEIRCKTRILLDKVRREDQNLNRNVAREKSFYRSGKQEKSLMRG